MTDSEAKTVKAPTFSGDPDDWQVFWDSFESYAGVQRFSQSLVTDPDLPATAATVPAGTAAAIANGHLALRRNHIAMCHLSMALTKDKDKALIYEAKENEPDWPSGLTREVVRQLKRRSEKNGNERKKKKKR